MRGIRWTRFLAAFLALSLLAAACGSDDESSSGDGGDLTDVKLTLQWVTQAQFAGYYAALDQGFYEEEGLDVTIQPGGPDLNGVQLLISGQTDIAIRQFGDVLTARGTGAARWCRARGRRPPRPRPRSSCTRGSATGARGSPRG